MGTWVHWVAFNLPPGIGGLAEDVPADFAERCRATLESCRQAWQDAHELLVITRGVAGLRLAGPGEAASVALVSRDLNWPVKALDSAHDALERHGDRDIPGALRCARRQSLAG